MESKRSEIKVALDLGVTLLKKVEEFGRIILTEEECRKIDQRRVFIATAFKKTNSGHVITIYQKHASAHMAAKQLRRLLGE
jgi:hypothetical protein